jgi:hypothetical protein
MSKISNVAEDIAVHLKSGSKMSKVLHKRYGSHGAINVTAALRLLLDGKRITRERVKGQKGYLYKLAPHPLEAGTAVKEKIAVTHKTVKPSNAEAGRLGLEFNAENQTWQTKKGLDAVKADPSPVVVTKDDIKAVGWNVNVPSASEGFDKYWRTGGPFSTPLWVGAPKSPELLAYIETYRREAYAAWVSAAKHFCPLTKVGETWSEVWKNAVAPKVPTPSDTTSTPS